MATQIAARLDQILPLILTQLQTVIGLPPERCFPSQLDVLPYMGQAEQVLIVRMEDAPPNIAVWKGAGRVDARMYQEFTVTVRTRTGLDERGNDLAWLLENINVPALGHLQFRHQVLDALLCFQPTDANGNVLTDAPIEPAPARKPRKDTKEEEWGESVLWFRFWYQLLLDQSRQ